MAESSKLVWALETAKTKQDLRKERQEKEKTPVKDIKLCSI